MAIASLHETVQFGILEKARLEAEIAKYQLQKNLAVSAQGDVQSLLSSEKHAIRDHYKAIFEEDPELQEKYENYTEIPDFEEEIDRITAKYQEQIEELTAWETAINAQLTTCSTELEELKAYQDSYKTMLSSNIQEDFDFSLGG